MVFQVDGKHEQRHWHEHVQNTYGSEALGRFQRCQESGWKVRLEPFVKGRACDVTVALRGS